MDKAYKSLLNSINHLTVLDRIFRQRKNYSNKNDYYQYIENYGELNKMAEEVGLYASLYHSDNRQMILADIIEYIFWGRGYFSVLPSNRFKRENLGKYIKLILLFVNLLMTYESMTMDFKLRRVFLAELKRTVKEVADEEGFSKLFDWKYPIGLPKSNKSFVNGAPNEEFDSFLPKTAGGLWHELLVYVFLLRFDYGFVFPLILHQKILSKNKHLSPPDFLLLAKDKRFYGVEVGGYKERQSGGFSVSTAIPIIAIDTENARASDRCPICNKWIALCPKIISEYANLDLPIERQEVRCLVDCDEFNLKAKLEGKCPYMKFKKGNKVRGNRISKYCDNLHYHFRCVISKISGSDKNKYVRQMRAAIDRNAENKEGARKATNALKTHFPYYSGLEELLKKNGN